MLDFVLVDKLLDQRPVLGLHDTWMPEIQKVIRFILSNREYVALPFTAKSAARPSLRSKSVQLIRELAKRLPRSKQIFAPEFLKPWHSYCVGNIAFLQKVADDRRDWRAFHAF